MAADTTTIGLPSVKEIFVDGVAQTDAPPTGVHHSSSLERQCIRDMTVSGENLCGLDHVTTISPPHGEYILLRRHDAVSCAAHMNALNCSAFSG